MFDLSDTICAISTPKGSGAIAAIRISGTESWNIAQKIFSSPQHSFNHMRAIYGFIKDSEKIIDEVVLLPFKSPNSYTAEDVIEIFCHGSNQIASMILDLCLKNGARLAQNGEFTFRAFINGKIDLTKAEAINEIIAATNPQAVYAVSEILSGSLKEKVTYFREKLFSLLMSIEGAIEFPMDVSQKSIDEIKNELQKLNAELINLINTSVDGQVLKNGIKVSIVGPPNAGKSSLLNQLLETERAIVTPEEGTTRDTVEETVMINGYPFVLVDTAGIREKGIVTEAEKIGIERTKKAIEKSDVSIFIYDLTQENKVETQLIESLLKDKTKITVGNKLDLVNGSKKDCDVAISAKFGTNIDQLKKILYAQRNLHDTIRTTQYSYINQRQKELLLQCSTSIQFAVSICSRDAINRVSTAEDLIADELKKAVSRLDEISGMKVNEEVIKNIFSKFCIGK